MVYAGASDEYLLFDLANGTNESIRFKGWKEWGTEPAPTFTGSCSEPDNGSSITVGPPFHWFRGTTGTITVSPGERLRVRVPKFSFESQYARRCRVMLNLKGGSAIGSNDFEAPLRRD